MTIFMINYKDNSLLWSCYDLFCILIEVLAKRSGRLKGSFKSNNVVHIHFIDILSF